MYFPADSLQTAAQLYDDRQQWMIPIPFPLRRWGKRGVCVPPLIPYKHSWRDSAS